MKKKLIGLLLLFIGLTTIGATTVSADPLVKPVSLPTSYSRVPQPSVNKITTNDRNLTGNGISGALIVAVVNNNVYKNTAGRNGNFSVDLKRAYPKGTKIDIYQNYQGVSSNNLTVFVSDASIAPPNKPQVNEISTDDRYLTGSGIPGALAIAVVNGNVYQNVVDWNGQFSIDLKKTYPKNTKVDVYQTHQGVSSDRVSVFVTEATVEIPNQPQVNTIYNDSRMVTGSADPNHTIYVTIGDKTYQGASNGTGRFEVAIDAHPVGTQVSAVSEKNGVRSETTVVYIIDNGQSQLTKPKIGDVTDKHLSVSGTADANMFIQLSIESDIYRATTDSNGRFTINLDNTYRVGTSIEVYAYDQKGNQSESFFAKVIQGELDLGIDYITSADTTLTGQATAYTSIEVTVGNRVYYSQTDGAGVYRVDFSRSYEAGTTVVVKAVDTTTGNSTEKSTLIYPKDPRIDYVAVGADRIAGVADPYAEVRVMLSGKTYSARADAAGSYSVYVSESDTFRGNKVSVVQVSSNLESRVAELIIE